MWTTKSREQEKFTISKVTHPEIKQHWHQRHMLFALQKHASKVKISFVYCSFLRLLIAKFVLKWKVDYNWETNDGKRKTLKVHPSVIAISSNINKSVGKVSQSPSVNKGKRKVDDMQRVDVERKEGTG